MIVLVCGGRDYEDEEAVWEALSALPISVLIQGGASGADALARGWAEHAGIHVGQFDAIWSNGHKAGPQRNQAMLDACKIDLVLAFPGGAGTEDMVRRAQRAGLKVCRIQTRGLPESMEMTKPAPDPP